MCLKDIHQRPLKEQKAILEEEHKSWKSDIEQIDDIMIMGVKLSFS